MFQIIVLLSIALLPIGLISVLQTRKAAEEAEAISAVSRLTLTERAVQDAKSKVATAHGAAGALSEFAELFRSDLNICHTRLRDFVEDQRRYNFAAVVALSGQTICSSSGSSPDFSQNHTFKQINKKSSPFEFLEAGGLNGETQLITVFHPLYEDGRIRDYLAISLIHEPLRINQNQLAAKGLLGITTFDAYGNVLTTTLNQQELITELPKGSEFTSISELGTTVFQAENAGGDIRDYTVVPVVRQTVYALGIWGKDSSKGNASWEIFPIFFPLLMWLVSLLVAIIAMHRLVVRHVRALGRRMREFTRDRELRDFGNPLELSAELIDIQDDFMTMAQGILHDEARLEDTLRSKNVLLKEVHHRVKNNLQLIASMMSFQIRDSKSPEARGVLAKVQERVLSLATIHQNVYQMQDMGRVDAAALLKEILQGSVQHRDLHHANTSFDFELDELMLYPDQAVPLSLLVSEGINNAVQFCEPDEKSQRWIKVSLKVFEDTKCELRIRNSSDLNKGADKASGVAALLLRAFVSQLNGQLKVDVLPHSYALNVEFDSDDFFPETTEF